MIIYQFSHFSREEKQQATLTKLSDAVRSKNMKKSSENYK